MSSSDLTIAGIRFSEPEFAQVISAHVVPHHAPVSPNLPPDSFSQLTLRHHVYYKIFQVGLPSLLLSALSLHPRVLAASRCIFLKTLLSFVYV